MGAIVKFVPKPIKRFIQRWLPASHYKQPTWSQCGEDRILWHLLHGLVKGRPIEYVDIGANHPFHFSNTALLYKKGGKGVLVEPNPQLAPVLKRKRPRDVILQCGVSVGGVESADYYMFDAHTLNTFSRDEALRYAALGQEQAGVRKIKLKDVNEILGLVQHLDFLNLDIEGMDFDILQGIDWHSRRPTTLCVETKTFETAGEPRKLKEIYEHMRANGYNVYADTFINTIFVDEMLWKSRFR